MARNEIMSHCQEQVFTVEPVNGKPCSSFNRVGVQSMHLDDTGEYPCIQPTPIAAPLVMNVDEQSIGGHVKTHLLDKHPTTSSPLSALPANLPDRPPPQASSPLWT